MKNNLSPYTFVVLYSYSKDERRDRFYLRYETINKHRLEIPNKKMAFLGITFSLPNVHFPNDSTKSDQLCADEYLAQEKTSVYHPKYTS